MYVSRQKKISNIILGALFFSWIRYSDPVCHQSNVAWILFRGVVGIRGIDTPLCFMGRLKKAKSVKKNLAIKKWGGNNYLDLKSKIITSM